MKKIDCKTPNNYKSIQQSNNPAIQMPVGEIFVMAGAFTFIFAILFCGMKPDRERRRPRIRNNGKCKCKCNKHKRH